ncbi:MAG: 2-C-methyl-D-erythritol 2,4-cyclodiphosphate synthase [Gammaproteobacteria bacterium 28-57-27]|nr:MAG: 2-C-methyl-D-erythritol 2,4-cyclodiphosphate synthase [Gammaproteobacteria bacterium 28-57-27]
MSSLPKLRIGQGVDVHAFTTGDHVVLGGVRIPHTHGLLAHSDGDVLIHALCDALLGAAALGDIGHHFPDTDPVYRGADSRKLLRHVMQLLAERAWSVVNADMTLLAQAPRVAGHIPQMLACLAEDMGVSVDQLSIKATTSERLGFVGREEGIVAMAVVMLAASV